MKKGDIIRTYKDYYIGRILVSSIGDKYVYHSFDIDDDGDFYYDMICCNTNNKLRISNDAFSIFFMPVITHRKNVISKYYANKN